MTAIILSKWKQRYYHDSNSDCAGPGRNKKCVGETKTVENLPSPKSNKRISNRRTLPFKNYYRIQFVPYISELNSILINLPMIVCSGKTAIKIELQKSNASSDPIKRSTRKSNINNSFQIISMKFVPFCIGVTV